MPRSRRRWCVLAGYALACSTALGTVATVVIGLASSAPPSTTRDSVAADDPSEHKFDPARVLGAKACIRCHRAEYVEWLKTAHNRSEQRLKSTNPDVMKIAEGMGIKKGDVLKNSICAACHATPQKSESGLVAAHGGVSCESCHGPAGGDPGWLNTHAVYGLEGTRREQETAAHRTARLAFCRKHGKIGPEDLYALARRCLQCHLIGDEKLVKAGHPVMKSPYEFASWSSGEVRHNFHLDQTSNAGASTLWMHPVGPAKRSEKARLRQMYVIGILADMEISLRLRGKATDANLAGTLAGRVGTANAKLLEINTIAQTAETKQVADAIAPLLGGLFTVQKGDEKVCNLQADKVAKAARDLLAYDSLSKLDKAKRNGLDQKVPKPYYPVSAKKKP